MAIYERQKSAGMDQVDTVAIFRPYPFLIGQRIYIDSGPRHGDWEVIDVEEDRIRLRCPVSGRQVIWRQFCYLIWEGLGEPWPHPPAAE